MDLTDKLYCGVRKSTVKFIFENAQLYFPALTGIRSKITGIQEMS